MHLFIDTNIYLSFLHYTSDELEELKKLPAVIRQKKVTLHLPEQVVDEFYRNRESKVADALKRLREQRLNPQLPQFCKEYSESNRLRDAQKAYDRAHSDLLRKVTEDALARNLRADAAIRELFDLADVVKSDDALVKRASLRAERGNPPGKTGSLGDAINWETLLQEVPKGNDLIIVTEDNDYASPLATESFSEYLRDEWKRLKAADVLYYRALSGFFRRHFPEIKLARDAEKDLLIADLANSGSFAYTHSIIAKLNQYEEFTAPQRDAIVAAAANNNQVGYIIADHDVKEFLTRAIIGHENKITDPGLAYVLEALREADEAENAEGTEA
ncbi:MAG TPA: PIN domain-containing protein [Burkholderiaceae bacterium]|nr:PIN domain-containing protein [Burkholderiaceae bacterium]